MEKRLAKYIEFIFQLFLSKKVKKRSEKFILIVSISTYILHLLLIFCTNQGWIDIDSQFLKNPIAAIYTPFSFILLYEVYLLIFFLPKSISYYIGKQYEIITLIVIRRIFKDISSIELSSNWFEIKDDMVFTYDVFTSLILFVLLYFFYKIIKARNTSVENDEVSDYRKIDSFILLKKAIAIILVPVLLSLAFITLYDWAHASYLNYENGILAFKDINNIFFDEFFTVLIIVEVLLLLASFFYSDQFHKIIRNSGFIISTILIKISFSVTGIVNNGLIIGAVLFGCLILYVESLHARLEKQ